jgi:hypothetical protein
MFGIGMPEVIVMVIILLLILFYMKGRGRLV